MSDWDLCRVGVKECVNRGWHDYLSYSMLEHEWRARQGKRGSDQVKLENNSQISINRAVNLI
jgi:hypothetical protein